MKINKKRKRFDLSDIQKLNILDEEEKIQKKLKDENKI